MEREEKNQRVCKAPETEFLLQWGNRKRLRCPRVKDFEFSDKSSGGIRRKITSRIDRNCEGAVLRSNLGENRKSSSPEKEDSRHYTTRGSGGGGENDNGKRSSMERNGGGEEKGGGGVVWPKLYITLSSKEKEEDFLAMKGCKPPQRPKKRAKVIQRSLLLVSPGAWLTDMSHERYEVREKKSSKKRPRGLKAMGGMESDSE